MRLSLFSSERRRAAAAGALSVEHNIHRRFFLGAIAVSLTLGATWGAYFLLQIAWRRSFTGIDLHLVNAHGDAQIHGWVGLFVMGWAYRMWPRQAGKALPYPRLAVQSFWLMLVGLVLHALGEAWHEQAAAAGAAALAGAVLEAAAALAFCGVAGSALRRNPRHASDYYLFAALCWFLIEVCCSAAYLAATLQTAEREGLLKLVALWQAPLREMQVYGFAVLMMLGIAQRFTQQLYDVASPAPRLARLVLIGFNAGLVLIISGLLLMRGVHHGFAALWYAGVLILAGSIAALFLGWPVFRRTPRADPPLTALRAACLWLCLSLAMLLLLPVERSLLQAFAPASDAARIGFSHAYYGAIRHAVTVGFVTQMMMAIAAKAVPLLERTLQGVSSLPFLLLNAGCALRVLGQTLTDFYPAAFPVTAVSGFLEVGALLLWGLSLYPLLRGRMANLPGRPQEPAFDIFVSNPLTRRSL